MSRRNERKTAAAPTGSLFSAAVDFKPGVVPPAHPRRAAQNARATGLAFAETNNKKHFWVTIYVGEIAEDYDRDVQPNAEFPNQNCIRIKVEKILNAFERQKVAEALTTGAVQWMKMQDVTSVEDTPIATDGYQCGKREKSYFSYTILLKNGIATVPTPDQIVPHIWILTPPRPVEAGQEFRLAQDTDNNALKYAEISARETDGGGVEKTYQVEMISDSPMDTGS